MNIGREHPCLSGPGGELAFFAALPPLVFFFFFFFFSAGRAHGAGPLDKKNPGSGNRGLTLMAGYDPGYLSYKEQENGGTLDRDYGYINSVHIQARLENKAVWARLTADFSWARNASYDGAIQDLEGRLTPYKSSTHEKIYLYEGDIGFKLFNIRTSTLTPYAGIGYRIWWRGADELPDYIEKYTWYFASAGFNYVWRTGRTTAGLDVAAHFPFDMKMTTNMAGMFDQTGFSLKKRVGFGARLPFTYEVYGRHSKKSRLFLFLTPYYQFWPVGGSAQVALTRNGPPLLSPGGAQLTAREPDSRTDVYGADAGVGVNF